MNSQTNAILTELYSKANPKNVEGMARYGIVSKNVLGLTAPFIKSLAKSIGRNHNLALELWNTGVYEARILAAFIADPNQITKKLMNNWAKDFDNWAICDGVCIHCFRKTLFAHEMASRWSMHKKEFVRRAGFTMMATLAVHDKEAKDSIFLKYLSLIKNYSTDERKYVKKAVNWALRQIGKRNITLNKAAIATATEIHKLASSSAKWIASDALRELQRKAVQKRLKKHADNTQKK